MGFLLSQGTVDEGILTCHWHHARFELGEGDTFDIWADDVQTYPVALRDNGVYLDPDPERTVSEPMYLDRFLNPPPAPIPDPGATDRAPTEVRDALLETFDEQGQVDRATRLVNEHSDAGGDPAALKRTLGTGLLREDANFHTLQNVEAAFSQFDRADRDGDRRVALMATARYMAAHFPTRREAEQTYTIADRLHRGESIHEATTG